MSIPDQSQSPTDAVAHIEAPASVVLETAVDYQFSESPSEDQYCAETDTLSCGNAHDAQMLHNTC